MRGRLLLLIGVLALVASASVSAASLDVIRGTRGPDTLNGTAGGDLIYARAGNDAVRGHDGGDRQGRLRVPEVVDSERPVGRGNLGDDASHHRDSLQGSLQLIRTVALVTEEDRIKTRPDEVLDIASHRLDDRRRTAGLVVERRARQRRQVRHRDGRLVDAEELLQVKRHFRI